MAQIEIIREEEIPEGGWLFHMQALDHTGTLRRYRLRLSWADYNLWSVGGSDAPGLVAEAVLVFMLTVQRVDRVPESFDASIARRLSPEADQAIPQLIQDWG